jgi:DNA-binding transcriptional LysR family regulator
MAAVDISVLHRLQWRMDRLDNLRIFVAVADANGFAEAARRLGLSASAVTRAVLALEQRLGAQLLHRTTRSLRVTEAGARFLDDCRRILADLDEAEASAGGAHSVPQGQLAITAPSMFGRLYVAPVVLDFLEQHRQVSARTLFVDRVVNLLDEGLDVAVRIAHLPDSGLTAIAVGAMRAVYVAAPSYLAEHGVPRVPADLVNHRAVGLAREGGQAAAWSFYPPGNKERSARERIQPPMRLVANSSEVAISAALRGHGIARKLVYQVADEIVSGRLQVILADYEPAPIPVHVVTLAGRKAPAKVRAFVDFAVERLRAEPVLGGAAFLA